MWTAHTNQKVDWAHGKKFHINKFFTIPGIYWHALAYALPIIQIAVEQSFTAGSSRHKPVNRLSRKQTFNVKLSGAPLLARPLERWVGLRHVVSLAVE